MNEQVRQQIFEKLQTVCDRENFTDPQMLQLLASAETANFEQSEKDRQRLCRYLITLLRDIPDSRINPPVSQKIEGIMARFAGDDEKHSLFGSWLIRRKPLLEDIIVRQGWLKVVSLPAKTFPGQGTEQAFILLALKHEQFDELTDFLTAKIFSNHTPTLANALCNQDPLIRQAALDYCRQLKDWQRSLIGQFFSAYSHFLEKDAALDWLTEQRFYSPYNEFARLIVSLLNDDFAAHNRETETVIRALARIVQENTYPHRQLPAKAANALRGLQTAEGREYFCDYILSLLKTERSCDRLVALALEMGYEPSAPADKALFFFLARHLEKYEAVDFDHRLLQTIHAAASNSLRRIITKVVRNSGRVDYLDIIATRELTANQTVYDQQKATLQILRSHEQWAQLWQKVSEFSLWSSLTALNVLQKEGWRPLNADERELFDRLVEISQAGVTSRRLQITPAELVEQPFAGLTLEHLAALQPLQDIKAELPPDTQNALLYIETILRHRFRYAIEVDFAPRVQLSEYDVELESD
jgi:hypothetical protein